jgi:hypothetical protein
VFIRAASTVARPIQNREGPAHLCLSGRGRARGGFLPIGTGGVPAESGWPAADGRRWSGRRASRQGGRPDWQSKRGEGLTERLLSGGGARWRATDGGKLELGSPAGSQRLGRKYLVARCLGWGRDGCRRAGVGCPWRLSDSKHDGVQSGTRAVKRWRRKKGGCSTVVCSLYSRQRRWKAAAQAAGTVGRIWR